MHTKSFLTCFVTKITHKNPRIKICLLMHRKEKLVFPYEKVMKKKPCADINIR